MNKEAEATEFRYELEKVTPGSYRFAPDVQAQEVLGHAVIYIRKNMFPQLGIKRPEDGFILTIKAATSK